MNRDVRRADRTDGLIILRCGGIHRAGTDIDATRESVGAGEGQLAAVRLGQAARARDIAANDDGAGVAAAEGRVGR